MTRTRMLRPGLFAAAMTAVLGFGAAQAFGSPAGPDRARGMCTIESEQQCRNQCLSYGADGGSCSSGVCRCFYW